MKGSIALGVVLFAGGAAVAVGGLREIEAPRAAIERPADAAVVDEDSSQWRATYRPVEDRARLMARLDRGDEQPLRLDGEEGIALPLPVLSPGPHFLELTLRRRGGRVTRITDEILAGPWQTERSRGCDLSLVMAPEGLRRLLLPVVEAKILAGARDNAYFGQTSELRRLELEVVEGGLRFDVFLDTTDEERGDLAVAGVIDVRGDDRQGLVASLRHLTRAEPGPKLTRMARDEGGRRLGAIGVAAGVGLVALTGGGALVGMAAAAGGGWLGAEVGEEVGERTARSEVDRQAHRQLERSLAAATRALRLPEAVELLPTAPALRADLQFCDAPRLDPALGLHVKLAVALHRDDAGEAAARNTVYLGAPLPPPRAPAPDPANLHVDVSADFLNRLLAEWVTRGGLQEALDGSGLREEIQAALGSRTRWKIQALGVERPPVLRPRAGGHFDAALGGVVLELHDPGRARARTVVLGARGQLFMVPQPQPGRVRLGGALDEVFFGCREREGARERRVPCFSGAVDPGQLRAVINAALAERSDRLPVLDLGSVLRLEAFEGEGARALGLEEAWIVAGEGWLSVDAVLR